MLLCPILASVSLRQLPSPRKSFNSDNMTCGKGPGIQSSWVAFWLKFQFSVRLCPILASVRFRQLPSSSVSTYIVPFRQHDMWGGGPEAKVPGSLFSLNSSFQRCLPDFSFRQLPSASFSTYMVQFRQHDMLEGARKPKFLGRFLD